MSMNKTKMTDVIIIPIKPVYANAILSGEKTVEFRKNKIPTNIKTMVLYSTKQEQKIVGYFNVKDCEVAPPDELWRKYGRVGHISFNDFNSYYKGKKLGKCFLVKDVYQFKTPILLENCASISKAPQSFAYLLQSEWKYIKRKS